MVRKIIISLFMVMAIFSFNSAGAQVTVVGQNNPTTDIQAVQKAVDQGGIINLKGTFDFGDKGRVNITKDVKIVGETDQKGGPAT
ncbi:MAG: right-handed parallel beta-helix repeat-containing protein, partial [Deltaproteobacteria bacterium]|nr:right-handed parallel beta-helix repeat-containing protein [Deltaproteobacteria bacterium]